MTENRMAIPFSNLPGAFPNSVNNINYSLNQIIMALSQNPSTKQGIIGTGATWYGKRAYGKPRMQTTWNVQKREIGNISVDPQIEIKG